MNHPIHLDVARYPRRLRWFMAVAWLAIAAKCWLVWWAAHRWSLAFNPLWVIAPTLGFATLVTAVWLRHRPE